MHEFLHQCKIHLIKKAEGHFDLVKIKSENKERAIHFFNKHGSDIQFSDKDNKAVIHYEFE